MLFRSTLERAEVEVPGELPFGAGAIVPLRAGERVRWRVT